MANRGLKAAFFGAASALAVLAGTVSAQAQSFADTLVAAYNNSGLLEQNQALLRAADENVAQSVATIRPILNYFAEVAYSDPLNVPGSDSYNGNVGLQFSWLLTDFGASRLNIDIQKEVVLATREGLRNIEQQVLFRAVQAYAGVLSNIALVELAENNVRVLDEQLRASRDRFEVGEVTRTDVSLAESRAAAARAQRAFDRGQLDQAREEFRAATGIEATALTAPPGPPSFPASENEGLTLARQISPVLRQAQRDVTANEIGVRAAQARLRPSLNLTARTSSNEDFDFNQGVTLQLSGPIYQGGQLASLIRQAQANRDAARGNLINTQFLIDQQVANAYTNLAVANSRITATEAQVAAAALALEGGREEQQLGARTTLDVLILEQEFFDAETDRVTALTDRFVAYYQILQAVGLLTVDNLGLNVPRYDVAAYYNAVQGAPTRYVSPQGEKLDQVLRALGRN